MSNMGYKTKTVIEDGKEYEVRIYNDGDIFWKLNGKDHFLNKRSHREKGPAMLAVDGYKAWRQNDLFHRLNGPAVITSYGGKKYWYINHILISEYKHTKIRIMLSFGLDRV